MITLRIKSCQALDKILECLEYRGYYWLDSGRKPTKSRIYKATLPKINVFLTLSVIDKKISKTTIGDYTIEVID